MREILYTSSDGTTPVYAYIWEPQGNAAGIIQFVHGCSEHMQRYKDFAGFMTKNGFIVCGHDQLGHGKTAAGMYGNIGKNGHKLLAKDTYKLTSILKKEYALPVVLTGAGCGSLVARYAASLWSIEYNGAIFIGTSGGGLHINFLNRLTSVPGVKKGREKDAQWIGKMVLHRMGRHFDASEEGNSWLTRDASEVSAFEYDPMCGHPLTYGSYIDILKLARITNSNKWAARMPKNLPTYLLSGLNDPMGDFGRGVVKVYSRLVNAGASNLEIRLYENARHEILFELNRYEVYEDIVKWIEGSDFISKGGKNGKYEKHTY